jgi:hypothetical protein
MKELKYTWTSNSMKSRGKEEAALKDIMEFSLMALILRSVDWNTFIPFPLCPITTNFGIFNPSPLLISKPDQKTKSYQITIFYVAVACRGYLIRDK